MGQDSLAATYKALLHFFNVAKQTSEHFQLHCLLWYYVLYINQALEEYLGNKETLGYVLFSSWDLLELL